MPERRRIPVSLEGIPTIPTQGQDSSPEEAEECDCPRLDPADWHDVESDWGDITFLGGATSAVLGVPVGYAATRDKMLARAIAAGATVPEDAMFLMGRGQFRRPVMLEVEGVSPSTRGVKVPGGVAYTRLVPAPWGEMKRRVKETESIARARYGRRPDGLWIWYLTCGVCSHARNFETLIIAHYRDRF